MNKKPAAKIDLYKLHKLEYVTPRKPVLLTCAPAQYLAIDGAGRPGGDEFTDRIGALYGMAFTIKMSHKFAGKQDYAVCKLEALWGSEDGGDFSKLPPEKWQWKLLIRTPEFITSKNLAAATETLIKRGKTASVRKVHLGTIDEGRCVQMLHVGPYEREADTIEVMKGHAEREGLVFHRRHHEIYLSDPRRVPPERLKTILRHPVAPV